MNKRELPSSANSYWPLNKKRRESKESLQQRETGPYHLRPRNSYQRSWFKTYRRRGILVYIWFWVRGVDRKLTITLKLHSHQGCQRRANQRLHLARDVVPNWLTLVALVL
ncbi:hypothetical protein TNCV_4869411 [Trichonephila clavipes]|nr:hypothetical protein TNCV_4869411 [Trichonephila clavipes]